MTIIKNKRLYLITFFSALICLTQVLYANGGLQETAEKRNQLIGYILGRQLPAIHFSDKKMDDDFSKAAFELYLKQLDFQKRFLLAEDVKQLRAFAIWIDDNLIRGNLVLAQAGYTIFEERLLQVEKYIDPILQQGFDINRDELFETDPEKLDYALDVNGLKERWRRIVKRQTISRYLDLEEEQKKNNENKTQEQLWELAKEKVAKRNRSFFHRLHQETLQDHYDRYFNAIARAFDPHTNYMPPANKEDFDIHMRGSLEGIGALLREEDGYIKIVRIIPGSASARQGRLKAEDIILEVAQGSQEPVDVTDMRLRDAVRLIRGPKGTEVRLRIRRPDGTKEIISIIRDVVQIEETFVKSSLIDSPTGGKIGYVMIPSFYRDFEQTRNGNNVRNSTSDTKKALQKLMEHKLDGVILDLRNNGGGALMDAVDITGLFIESGPVVQVKDSFGTKKVLEDVDPEIVYNGPLIVLVNKFSASASEIVAAALQDYGRAIVVGGDHTHGKGSVQTIIDLNEYIPMFHLKRYEDLGALKVMIQKYYRVTGGSVQYKGVEPDIVLPSLFKHLKTGERYLDHALPWDKVEPVEYERYSGRSFDSALLIGKSKQRVTEDLGMMAIAEEAERTSERSEKTAVSLRVSDLRQKRLEARQARKKIGAHYLKYRQEKDDGDLHSADDDDSQEQSKDRWLKEIKEDPYIREASMIIRDMIMDQVVSTTR